MSQMDIRDFLTEAQSGSGLWNHKSHKEKIGECLRYFAANGIPLSVCSDKRHLDRAVSTLKEYARDLKLIFSDYCPRDLREKKGAKNGR